MANNAERTNEGSVTPIDPRTGKRGKAISVDDPYNMYLTPDGKSAIIVAEARRRLAGATTTSSIVSTPLRVQ